MTQRGVDAREDERRLIEVSLAQVREEAGLSLTFWGTAHHGEGILSVDAFAGEVLGSPPSVRVRFGSGLGGKVASARRPMAVDDYFSAERISHHYDDVIRAEELRGMLAIPIVVRRRVRAVLYGATRGTDALDESALRHAAEGARDIEQQLAVHDALHGDAGGPPAPGAAGDERTGAEWERAREAFARLRVLAARCSDESLRTELTALADSLAEPLRRDDTLRLTTRELDVLACVSQGMSNPETGRALALSPETVKSYLRSAMRRLGATSRWGAVVSARRAGLLP